jgi:hypothetical protein
MVDGISLPQADALRLATLPLRRRPWSCLRPLPTLPVPAFLPSFKTDSPACLRVIQATPDILLFAGHPEFPLGIDHWASGRLRPERQFYRKGD